MKLSGRRMCASGGGVNYYHQDNYGLQGQTILLPAFDDFRINNVVRYCLYTRKLISFP